MSNSDSEARVTPIAPNLNGEASPVSQPVFQKYALWLSYGADYTGEGVFHLIAEFQKIAACCCINILKKTQG